MLRGLRVTPDTTFVPPVTVYWSSCSRATHWSTFKHPQQFTHKDSKFIWCHQGTSLALACITLFKVSLIRTGLRAAKSFFCFGGVLATIFGISEEWNQTHTQGGSQEFHSDKQSLQLVPSAHPTKDWISISLSLYHSLTLSLIGRHGPKPFCFWLQGLAPRCCWRWTNTNSL